MCDFESCCKNNLETHIKSHRKYKCIRCKKLFDNKILLSKHEKQAHQVKCKFQGCQKIFTRKDSMNRHFIRCRLENRKMFECDFCGLKYSYKYNLIVHIESKHLDNKYKCEICNRELSSKLQLNRHYSTRHRDFICEICNRMFNSNHLLSKHLKIQHFNEEKLIECEICLKKFNFMNDMTNHKRMIHVDKKIKCQSEICDKMFTNNSGMKKHYNYAHLKRRKEKIYVCDLCNDMKFETKSLLVYHIESHHLKKKFNCEKCGKALNSKNSLWSHSKTHEKKICKFEGCTKMFYFLSHMNRHYNEVHLNIKRKKRFACDLCGWKMAEKTHLKTHIFSQHIKTNSSKFKKTTNQRVSQSKESSNCLEIGNEIKSKKCSIILHKLNLQEELFTNIDLNTINLITQNRNSHLNSSNSIIMGMNLATSLVRTKKIN